MSLARYLSLIGGDFSIYQTVSQLIALINQSLRDTWLSTIKNFPSLDYRIVMGDGTPVEESFEFTQSWESRGSRYIDKPTSVQYRHYIPKDDELILSVPDDYKHLCFKTRAAHRWAVQRNFDFIFQSYADVYIDLDRLVGCGFDTFQYRGGENGGGFWLNKEAFEFVGGSEVTAWNDDGWIRDVLKDKGILLKVDPLYAATPHQPEKINDLITSHLTISPAIHTPSKTYEAHQKRRG